VTLNATELAAVAADLSARLHGAVVQRVREQEQHSERLALRLRQPGENLQLLIDIAADTCRAHLVDDMPPAPGEPSAFVMLLRKHLGGAAIDVFPKEPSNNKESFSSPLQGLDNVILTPHVGGSTEEAQERIGEEVARKLADYSDIGTTVGAVNFPEVALPSHPGKHRILHVHHNVPGILSAINQIFSELGVNVAAQYLQTHGSVGYVVIDTDTDQSGDALARLKQVAGTIRTRILF
jgi:D-3-phosphoglycerate dehydrogenase